MAILIHLPILLPLQVEPREYVLTLPSSVAITGVIVQQAARLAQGQLEPVHQIAFCSCTSFCATISPPHFQFSSINCLNYSYREISTVRRGKKINPVSLLGFICDTVILISADLSGYAEFVHVCSCAASWLSWFIPLPLGAISFCCPVASYTEASPAPGPR